MAPARSSARRAQHDPRHHDIQHHHNVQPQPVVVAQEPAISKDDIAELEKELKAAGADVAAFEYVRRTREISKMMAPSALGGSSTPIPGTSTPGGELFKGFSALGNRVGPFHWILNA